MSDTGAAGGGAWSALFGENSVVRQIVVWQVFAQMAQALLGPFLSLVAQAVNENNPVTPLSPAQLADMVVRGFEDQDDAAGMAAKSGISKDLFQLMVYAAADAPSPTDLVIALRRGIIAQSGSGPTDTSFETGIREGRLNDKWAPIFQQLAVEWPTPTDALQAYLEGQIDETTAQDLYQKFGGDPDYFTMLFNTRGNAPTPAEGLEMLRRGIIPATGTGPDATSYEQLFLEGPWRNKWLPAFQALETVLPSGYYIMEMLGAQAISVQDASDLLTQEGYSPDVVAAWIAAGTSTGTATQKALTQAQILDLYQGGMIDEPTATAQLESLGYDSASIAFLLQLQLAQRAQSQLNSAISRIQTLYVGHKIDRNTAVNALNGLEVPPAGVDQLLQTWDLEVQANVALPTQSDVRDAFEYGVLDQPTAQQYLEDLGYTPYDAWMLLSVTNKAPLPDEPPAGAGPVGSETSGG